MLKIEMGFFGRNEDEDEERRWMFLMVEGGLKIGS